MKIYLLILDTSYNKEYCPKEIGRVYSNKCVPANTETQQVTPKEGDWVIDLCPHTGEPIEMMLCDGEWMCLHDGGDPNYNFMETVVEIRKQRLERNN